MSLHFESWAETKIKSLGVSHEIKTPENIRRMYKTK